MRGLFLVGATWTADMDIVNLNMRFQTCYEDYGGSNHDKVSADAFREELDSISTPLQKKQLPASQTSAANANLLFRKREKMEETKSK
nr:hypothetical protein B0A51_16404 [Rachicladosporium sp. CCFEE 5018]